MIAAALISRTCGAGFVKLFSAQNTPLGVLRRLYDGCRRVLKGFLAQTPCEPKTGTVISPPSLCPCSCHGEQFTGHSP